MPRSIAELNAIRGSHRSPSTEEELPGDGHHGFDPNQPRVPAGHSDGGQWTDTAASGPASSRREAELDETDEEAWKPVSSTYRRDGRRAEQEVVNRDGSRIHSQFSLDPRIAGWDERHTVTLPDGQQITFENSGDVQKVYDADGQLIAANEWTSEGPQPYPMVQLARGTSGGGLFRRLAPGIRPGVGEANPSLLGAAGAALFTWLSSQNRDGAVVLAFNARDFGFQDEKEVDNPRIAWVGRLTRDEVKKTCDELDDVQRRTDKAVEKVRKDGEQLGPADFGTKVHKMIADGINGLKREDYKAEVSGMKSGQAEAYYGKKGSIRIDAYERLAEISTTCAYDPKTGGRGLSLPRMKELAQTAYRLFGTKRIIVIEVRPGQM